MSETPEDIVLLDNALQSVYDRLHSEDERPAHTRTAIAFLGRDAIIAVERLPVEAYVLGVTAQLLGGESGGVTEDEALDWLDAQPAPVLGTLDIDRFDDDGRAGYAPTLSFQVQVDGIVAEFVEAVIAPFAAAWVKRSVAIVEPHPWRDRYRVNPVDHRAQSVWLLMGDAASYPTADDLDSMRADAEAGVYNTDWTAPKNGAIGDLALIYFVAPASAACFVARFAELPFWDDETEVNADSAVDIHQWWTYLTPLVEIEPIPFATLREVAGGHLPLCGRSGHYLSPDLIGALTFTARHADDQVLVDHIARRPAGSADLPDAATMTFDDWRTIPTGALPLEAKVSEYVVEPFVRFMAERSRSIGQFPWPSGVRLVREYRTISGGYVDFLLELQIDEKTVPLLAIEVKLAVRRPVTGDWSSSPDFRQLLGYMRDLDVPGLLVDAHGVLVVAKDADAPIDVFTRALASDVDFAVIFEELTMLLGGGDSPQLEGAARRVTRRG